MSAAPSTVLIIPQREKIGSYDILLTLVMEVIIIPQREKIGSYDRRPGIARQFYIIPQREKIEVFVLYRSFCFYHVFPAASGGHQDIQHDQG